MSIKQTLLAELENVPESLLVEVADFIRFLKAQRAQDNFETALLSETALRKDWLRPEEDEAWQDL